jgi:hypothetical protein
MVMELSSIDLFLRFELIVVITFRTIAAMVVAEATATNIVKPIVA